MSRRLSGPDTPAAQPVPGRRRPGNARRPFGWAAAWAAVAVGLTGSFPASAQTDSLRFSLAQATEMAVERHLGWRSAQLTVLMEQQAVIGERARFGRTLTASATQQNTQSPSSSKLEGVRTSTSASQSLGLSLTQQLSSGGSVGVDFRNTRSSSNAAFQLLNPQYQSGLTLRVSQPLLQGRGKVNRIGLEMANNNLTGSRVSAEDQRWQLETQVGQAYWSLVMARQSLGVREQLLAGAERVLETMRTRAEVGSVARSAVLEAQVGVAQRRQEIVAAEGAVRQAEDQLRALLGIDQQPGGWAWVLVPTDVPAMVPFIGEAEVGVERATARDAACRQAEIAVRNASLQLALLRDQARPSVSLTAQASLSGIGGSYGDDLQTLRQAEARNWQGSLGLNLPLSGNPVAQARVREQELANQQRQLQLEQARLQVAAKVRSQHRQVGINRQAEEAAAWTEQQAEQNVQEQEERLGLGLSTVRQVLDAQDALAQSKLARQQAAAAYNNALLEWHRLTGE